MRTEALSSMAFVPAQKLSSMQCSVNIALVIALKWDYFREQSNSENIQKSNTLTIFILYDTLYLPLLPYTFCMKDAQYLISVGKLKIFFVAWEQGAAGCS